MIFDAANFIFEPPRELAFARRILIKPCANTPQPHPVTSSRETLEAVITGIKTVSGADIVILERSTGAETMQSVYKQLGFNFPHTTLLDVEQCVPVAVENPLPKAFAIPTFWVPNVILSCDFLITIAPYKTVAGNGLFSIWNLLGLLPTAKYQQEIKALDRMAQRPDINAIAADLYFTLPFDMGIVDGRKKLTSAQDPSQGEIVDCGRIFVGSPYEVDCEASRAAGVTTEYLRLIEEAKAEKEKANNDS